VRDLSNMSIKIAHLGSAVGVVRIVATAGAAFDS
jgi:hypothetical protein